MPDNLGDFLSIALTVVALATLAGYGLLRGNVQNLREQLKDEREARNSLQGRFDQQEKEKIDLAGKVRVLESIVTGEVHWVALGDKLDEHHNEAKDYWTRAETRDTHSETLLTEIRDALRNQKRTF